MVLARRFVKPSQTSTASGIGVHVGETAPNFLVISTNGVPLNSKHSASKAILLEIFATWCGYCQHAVPELNELFAQYHDRVDFVAVNGSLLAADKTTLHNEPDVRKFGDRYEVRFPLYWDRNLFIAQRYLQQQAFPTYILISRQNKIAYYAIGERGLAALPAALKGLSET